MKPHRSLVAAAALSGCGYFAAVSRTAASGTAAPDASLLAVTVLYDGSDAHEASADQGGVVWVATADGVWAFTDGGALQFTAENSGLTFDDVRTVAGGPGGQALAGFAPQGTPGQSGNPPALNYLTLTAGPNGTSADIESYNFNLTDEIIQANHAVFDPLRDQFWIGTNEGISLFDSSRDVIEHRHPVHPHGFSNGVAIDPDGNVWDGDEFQLSRLNAGPQADFDATFDPVLQPFPLVQQNCSAVSLDAQGRVWVGSINQGLALVDPNALTAELWTAPAGLPSMFVQAVAVDPDGSIWVGTANQGLGRLDPATGDWQLFDQASGLPSNDILSLYVEPAMGAGPRTLLITSGAGVLAYTGP